MAGYAKTLIFPTSSTLGELVAIVSGENAAAGYRGYVWASVLLFPIVLGFAARCLAGGWSAFTVALALGVVWTWVGWPSVYAGWGMGSFVLASAASIWAGVRLASWLQQPSWPAWTDGTLLATLATIAHPSSPVILVLMLLPAYLACAGNLTWRAHLAAWAVPVLVVLAWSPWWFPAALLWDTYGTTQTGLFNPNVRGRIMELITGRFAEERALFVAALGSAAGLYGLDRARSWSAIAGAAALFLLAYPAGMFRWAWTLQHGRYSQPFFALLLVLVASGSVRLARELRGRPGNSSRRLALAIMLLCSAAATALITPKTLKYILARPLPPVRMEIPEPVRQIADRLRDLPLGNGRVLFEDRGDFALDPFAGTNPSALMPLLAPGQYVGGPYLYTHLKTNFTQCGDGKFLGRPMQTLDRATVERYARLYNLQWAVLWSPPMIRLAEGNSDLFRSVARHGPLHLYELARAPNWAVAGSASVVARPDRLEVREASPNANGTLILSYHWIRTLHSSVPMRPVYLLDDPAPFIAVDRPPGQFVIENRLW
jgi:hypothetical protein